MLPGVGVFSGSVQEQMSQGEMMPQKCMEERLRMGTLPGS